MASEIFSDIGRLGDTSRGPFKLSEAQCGWQNRETKEIWKAPKDSIEKALWVSCGPYGTVELTVNGEKVTFTGIKANDEKRLTAFFENHYGVHTEKLDMQTRGSIKKSKKYKQNL